MISGEKCFSRVEFEDSSLGNVIVAVGCCRFCPRVFITSSLWRKVARGKISEKTRDGYGGDNNYITRLGKLAADKIRCDNDS